MVENYIIIGLTICSFLILALIILIFKAYMKRQSILGILQGDIFKPEMAYIASIAQALMFMSFVLVAVTFFLFILCDRQWNSVLEIPIFLSLFSIIASFILLFKIYNWQVNYLKYRYIGLVLTTIGIIGNFLKVESNILATELCFTHNS